MSLLFSPLQLRDVTFRNRIFVSPMCQYSSRDGLPTDWHLVHLGSRAVGGAGMVTVEATAVTPPGRISPDDSGLWSDAHRDAFRPITRFIREQGAVPAIQLAHAGRKAATGVPWRGGKPLSPEHGGWRAVAPSPIPFADGYPAPVELSAVDIEALVDDFAAAARRAHAAGFAAVELHMAHGYLLHEFLSPLSNQRKDRYGGSLERRMSFPLAVAHAVRETWPRELPLLVRISGSDWAEGGWDLDQSVGLAHALRKAGVDLIDCSGGGLVAHARVPLGPGYQTPFAARIRAEARIPTAAVGLITDAVQAEHVLQTGQADAVSLARAMLRDPYWPLHAARVLGAAAAWPVQYLRAKD